MALVAPFAGNDAVESLAYCGNVPVSIQLIYYLLHVLVEVYRWMGGRRKWCAANGPQVGGKGVGRAALCRGVCIILTLVFGGGLDFF